MVPASSSRARGAAISEFLLVAAPLLLAGLGVVETARWYLVRQAVDHALLEAARAGATQHASPAALEQGLRRGLLPLYASAPTSVGLAQGQQRLAQLQIEFEQRYGLTPWQLETLSPSAAHFTDFMLADAGDGVAGIPNSYQQERHADHLALGWPDGRGPVSTATLFEANTLTVRLTYLYTPLVPGIGWLLRGIGSAAGRNDYAGTAMSRAGLLPIRRQLSVTMQSHPRPTHGRVTAIPSPAPSSAPGAPSPAPAACVGLWCMQAAPGAASIPPGEAAAATPPASPWLPTPGANDGCGVVLCCTGLAAG